MAAFPVLLLAVGACSLGADGSIADPPTRPVVPTPSPLDAGVLLPVPAPQDHDGFPIIGWDLDRNALIVLDRPRREPTNLVRIDLTDLSVKPLAAISHASVLRTGGSGVVAFTDGAFRWGTIGKQEGMEITSLGPASDVHFALSGNGRWGVFKDTAWQVVELATGARTALPKLKWYPVAVSDDGARVAFGLPEYSSEVTIVDVSSGAVETLHAPAPIRDAVYSADGLHLLVTRSELVADTMKLRVYDVTGSGESTELGSFRGGGSGGCAVWSRGSGPRVAVVSLTTIPRWPSDRSRVNFMLLGDGDPRVAASVDIWYAVDCNVSPDGRWFVYGDPTGYIPTGRLYLKKIR
jgi:hypothetical protein